jgi:hypothetical protein
VDGPIWKHWLTIVEPERVATRTGFLIVSGGSNESKPPARMNPVLAIAAVTTSHLLYAEEMQSL